MKTLARFATALLAAATLFLTGCSGPDSHEKLADDVMAQMEKLANAMSEAKDKATAEKAAADIKAMIPDFKKLGERAKALGKASPEVATKIQAKLKPKQEELSKKMAGAGPGASPEAGLALMGAVMELMPHMQEIETAIPSPKN
jgi:hypothetical protein